MLSESINTYLQQAAREARTQIPDRDTSLFQAGILDSFSLVEFVTLLENEYNIRVSDAELRPDNFETISKVEEFIAKSGVVV